MQSHLVVSAVSVETALLGRPVALPAVEADRAGRGHSHGHRDFDVIKGDSRCFARAMHAKELFVRDQWA